MAQGRKVGGKFQFRRPSGNGARIIVGIGNIKKAHSPLNWLFKKCEFVKEDKIVLLHVMTNLNKEYNDSIRADASNLNKAFDERREIIFGYLTEEVSCLLLKYYLPEVSISLRVVRSSEIHTVIISEAQRIHATAIVLGSSSRLFPFGASHSIRKQCIKHLPAFCSIVALMKRQKLSVEAGAAPAILDSSLGKLLRSAPSVNEDNCMKADVAEVKDLQNVKNGYNQDEKSPSYLTSGQNETARLFCTETPSTDSETQFSYLSSFTSNGSSAISLDSPFSVLSSLRCACSCKALEKKVQSKKAYLQYMGPKDGISFGHNKVSNWLQSNPNGCPSIKCPEQDHVIHAKPLPESEGIEETSKCCDPKSGIDLGAESISKRQEEGNLRTETVCCTESVVASHKELKPVMARTADTTVSMERYEEGIVLEKYVFHGWEGLLQEFSFRELELATNNFSTENMIGGGGSSKVFKGRISKGGSLAIKKLASTLEAQDEFLTEIGILSKIRHRHVVSLIGYCLEGFHRLLVYEFLKNGNLQQRLQGEHHDTILPWDIRQQVALGAARGLNYLHTCAPSQIIHRDVKTSNILLTDHFEAQISDFGYANLRRRGGATEFSINEVIFGTFGYLAPECLVSAYYDEKSDVYSFGVVLLELISGRSSIDFSLPCITQSLAHWALLLEKKGETHELVDHKLVDIIPLQMKRMMYVALQCIKSFPEKRPTMGRVLKLLDPKWECTEPLLANHST